MSCPKNYCREKCVLSLKEPQQPFVSPQTTKPLFVVVASVSVLHLCNDMMQAVVPALLPVLRNTYELTFTQMGWILFALNITSALLQPCIGTYSDRKPTPWLLPLALLTSVTGMMTWAWANTFLQMVCGAVLVGLGSAMFHPEAAKVVYTAAGHQRGLSQSIYQVGGNGGTAIGPLFTKTLFFPFGQVPVWLFVVMGALAATLAYRISRWYNTATQQANHAHSTPLVTAQSSATLRHSREVACGLIVLSMIMFARSTYYVAITQYYQYYYAQTYHTSVVHAQFPLLFFGLIGVGGTLYGGHLADRYGAKKLMFWSMIGCAPFAMMLPFVPQVAVFPVLLFIGFILMLGFSIVVVYAQKLMPHRIATASGIIVGLAFGMGAIAAGALGYGVDQVGLQTIMRGTSFLPLCGFLVLCLPREHPSTASSA